MGRARGVGHARAVFLCGFAALREKKMPRPLSEHDLKDLWDLQDGVVSCTSFNLLNLVQEGGQGARGAFASKKNATPLCLNTI
jgi:hypothetical protein